MNTKNNQETQLASPSDVEFSSEVRERASGITFKNSSFPRGYSVSRSQDGTRIALSFHPNLVQGDVLPAGNWNIPGRYIAHDDLGAFALIEWEPIEDCPPGCIQDVIYEHWQGIQATKEEDPKTYWGDFPVSEERQGGW